MFFTCSIFDDEKLNALKYELQITAGISNAAAVAEEAAYAVFFYLF